MGTVLGMWRRSGCFNGLQHSPRSVLHHEQEQGIVHVTSHVISCFSIRRSEVVTVLLNPAPASRIFIGHVVGTDVDEKVLEKRHDHAWQVAGSTPFDHRSICTQLQFQAVGQVFVVHRWTCLYTREIMRGSAVSLMHAMDHPGLRSMREALAQDK